MSSGLSGLYGSGYTNATNQAYQQALQNAYALSGNYYVTGTGAPTLGTGSSGTYTTTGNVTWNRHQTPYIKTPYINKEDGWDAEQSQEAVSHGWMLTEGDNDYPDLEAVSWGTKKHMNEKEILQDVLTMCLTGECPIAHKILHLLSKNRSPFAEYTKVVESMEADYSN